MSKLISYLGLVASALLALSPLVTAINPKYAALAAVAAAFLSSLGERLTRVVTLPGGPVATAIGAAVALLAALGGITGPYGSPLFSPEVAAVLAGVVAGLTAFGQSVWGWQGPLGRKGGPPRG